MTLVSEHIELDTRERILEVAARLFREIGYQKTTVADIAKVLRMSPANVYRFFDSKKAIHEGVARTLMGGGDVCLYCHDAVFPPADDRAIREQAGSLPRPDDRLCPRRPRAARPMRGSVLAGMPT